MQTCGKCGRQVKYIATDAETVAVCDAEETAVITEGGHKVRGYAPHTCTEADNGTEGRRKSRE